LLAPLVLRVDRKDSRYSRNDHNSFRCHRGFRDIPWNSRHHRRPNCDRWRRARPRHRHCRLPTSTTIEVGMPTVSRLIRVDVVLAGTRRDYTPAVDRQRADPAETIDGTSNTDASCARRRRPSPTPHRLRSPINGSF
jgi:hypothetical protein